MGVVCGERARLAMRLACAAGNEGSRRKRYLIRINFPSAVRRSRWIAPLCSISISLAAPSRYWLDRRVLVACSPLGTDGAYAAPAAHGCSGVDADAQLLVLESLDMTAV